MRKEIDRMLGNSLRCILPSYWWKRLLGKMADRIESAIQAASNASRIAMLAGTEAADKQDKLYSGSNIKTINNQNILGSGNITISTKRMEKYKTKEELDAIGSTDGGEIAAVIDDVLIEKSFTECYQPTSAEISINKYDAKFTKVDGISLNPDFNPNLMSSNYGELSVMLYSDGKSKGYYKGYPSHLEIKCDYNRQILCYEYDGNSGTGYILYDLAGFNASNIDRVNDILREGNFRFSYFEVTYRNDVNATGYTHYYSYNANFPSDATAMIDNVVKMLFADTQNADIYVRSKEWVRLLKEGDITGGGTGPLRVWINEVGGGENDSEQIAENAATFRAMWNEKPQQAIFSAKADLGGFPMIIAKPIEAYRLLSVDGMNMVSMTYSQMQDQGNGLEVMNIYVYLKEDGSVTVEYQS